MANGQVKTFSSSDEAISYLQNLYGTATWNQYEYVRWPFYSYQQYPSAGQVTFNFFNQTVGGNVTLADTNMKTAGNFQGGWNFLVMSIGCKFRLLSNNLTAFTGADATTIVSDLLMGFAQAGVLTWQINAFNYLQLPLPFLYAPPNDGEEEMVWAGATSATVSRPPQATLNSRRKGVALTRPVLIESGQTFSISIQFLSDVVPVIATSIVNDSTNPLKIGVELDGILFRPGSS